VYEEDDDKEDGLGHIGKTGFALLIMSHIVMTL
jgi:hypothetical protein